MVHKTGAGGQSGFLVLIQRVGVLNILRPFLTRLHSPTMWLGPKCWNLTLHRFGQIFGGLVAYGIDRGVKATGAALAPWKIIFLVNGCLTAALGFVFLYVIPDNQLNARWLAPRDRVLAVARVRVNQQGIGNKHFKMYQLKEALTDPMTWAFVFYALTADIPNGGISNFFSQLVSAYL